MGMESDVGFKTMDELDAARAHILDAPKDAGIISTLCFRPSFGERVFADTLTLSSDDGVIGDRWKEHAWLKLPDGSADPRIQVCILSKRMLDLVWQEGDKAPYPGDTMIADMDFSEHPLPVGSQLKAGTAIVEVSDVFNDACTKWKARYGAASREWINRPDNVPHRFRGVLCKIVQDGEVQVGENLVLLKLKK